jgi:predicted RNA-binding Zn-ribbon protein involved in translation (DUF1610 family)
MTHKISLFPNIKQNKPTPFSGNIEIIAKGLLSESGEVQKKQDIPLWSPTVFRGTRSSTNALDVGFLVFDLDDGKTPYDTWRLFSKWTVFAHTSFSHKPHFHKYRIILPLDTPVPSQEWNRASQWACNFWDEVVGIGEPDPKAIKDVARIYFRYAIPKSDLQIENPLHPRNYFRSDCSFGPLLHLDWESIPKEQPKQKTAPKAIHKRNQPISLGELELDSDFRAKICYQVGGKMVGNTARYILCPQCGDKSVYFSIDLHLGNTMKFPQCNHKNSCGWWGTLQDLL